MKFTLSLVTITVLIITMTSCADRRIDVQIYQTIPVAKIERKCYENGGVHFTDGSEWRFMAVDISDDRGARYTVTCRQQTASDLLLDVKVGSKLIIGQPLTEFNGVIQIDWDSELVRIEH